MKNEALVKALDALGYKDKGNVTVKSCGYMRVVVYVGGREIGIWDQQKETFVD